MVSLPSTTKPRSASVNNGRRANEFVTDAVDEKLDTVLQMLSATKSHSLFVNSGSAKEVVTDTVDERLDGQREKEILTDAVDGRLNAVALSKQRDEDAGILDADGDSNVLIVEDQTLPTDSNEGAGILDADENSDYKTVEEQSLPINSEKVAAWSRKRKDDEVQRKVTDPHSGSNDANCNGTSRPSGNTNKDLNRRKTDFSAAMFVDAHGSKTENDPGSSSISDIKTVCGRDASVQKNRSAPHTQNRTFKRSKKSASDMQNRTSTSSNQSASPVKKNLILSN
ncbi:hypothetical protein MKX03_023288 [Papaver bracteatum]|nr:hypothetical protein MKX03_023288 [Papaver bracteatum]